MDNQGKLLLRLTVGGLLILHGIAKFGEVPPAGIEDALAAKDLPAFLAYGVYVGEALAPALLIVGFFTRIAAVVVALNMGMAIFLMHASDVLARGPHGGWAIEAPGFFLLAALCIALLGPGRFSLDGRTRGAPAG